MNEGYEMMTIDDYRLLAMTPSQAHREKRILEKSAENRQKSAENGRKNTGENKNDTQITNDVTP